MSDLRKSVLNSQQHSRWTESSQSSRASTSHAFGSRSSGASIRYISVPRIPSSGQSSKIERKLREFLLNFKSGGISINDGVEQILKYVNKYGTNSNHEHERVDKLSGASSSTFHTQRQQPPKAKPKPKPKTMTSKTVHHQSKSKQLALEKELARLADSDGFVSTPPRRLKRKPKPVVLFDTVQYETKRKLRSSDRHRADVDTIQKTITKEVQHTNATRVVNVSPNIANNMENVTQSSRTSSSFGMPIDFHYTI